MTPASGSAVSGRDDVVLSPSGLQLVSSADDGFAVAYDYDRAGRVNAVRVSSAPTGGTVLWAADSLDDAGRVTREHYGNGEIQSYSYDALGMTSDVRLTDSGSNDLYHVTIQRTAYGAPKIISDPLHPGAASGVDHSLDLYLRHGRALDRTCHGGHRPISSAS